MNFINSLEKNSIINILNEINFFTAKNGLIFRSYCCNHKKIKIKISGNIIDPKTLIAICQKNELKYQYFCNLSNKVTYFIISIEK